MLRGLSDWDQLNIYTTRYQGNVSLMVEFVMGMGMRWIMMMIFVGAKSWQWRQHQYVWDLLHCMESVCYNENILTKHESYIVSYNVVW